MIKINYEPTEFVPAPEGLHRAVCVDVVDLGMVTQSFNGDERTRRKLNLVWQIEASKQEDAGVSRRPLVSRRYTASLHPKASVRKDLESWRGGALSPEELRQGFDFESLVGRPAMVQVVHNTSVYDGQEKTFANVQNVLPAIGDPLLPDGHYVRVHDRTRE